MNFMDCLGQMLFVVVLRICDYDVVGVILVCELGVVEQVIEKLLWIF